jgi:hypothetical protein
VQISHFWSLEGRKEGRKRLGIGVLIGILLLASSENEVVGGKLET